MDIKIKGASTTKFGELWEKSFEDLLFEATTSALKDASLSLEDIDQIYVANMLAGETSSQSCLGSLFAEHFGVSVPAFRVEAACASGGVALYQAIQSLFSNQVKNVLVVGVEKMTDVAPEIISRLLMQAASEEERLSGITFAGLYALMAQEYLRVYNVKREEISALSVLNHRNAINEPFAQFRKEIFLEDVLTSSLIAEPLRLLDCSPITDGASAVILSSQSSSEREVSICSSACATSSLSLSKRDTLTSFPATQKAMKSILSSSQIDLADISLLEIHDCFSIAGVIALEDMGFIPPGRAPVELIKEINGKKNLLPDINLSGGLKAFGHPVGATGVRQIVSLSKQLKNISLKDNTKIHYALSHNVGGVGAVCVLHLIKYE